MSTDRATVTDQQRPVALVAVLVAVLACLLLGSLRFAQASDVDPNLVGLTDQPDGWYLSYDDPELARDIRGLSFDVYEYHAYVEYFRGDFDRYPIYGPWRWRLVPSLLASWTPIENPAVAYASVTLGLLVIGAAAVVAVAARNGLGTRGQVLTGLLYSVSFPVVWYGTSGYIDGSSMALLCVALWFIQSRYWWPLLVLIPIGMLTKETFLIIVPVAATFLWVRAKRTSDWLPWTVAFAGAAVVAYFGARFALTTPRTLDWMPRINRFIWNITRPSALVSFALTCGFVVLPGAWKAWDLWVARTKSPEGDLAFRRDLHLLVGFALGMLVAIHGFLTAYADGRHAWTMYPFGLVLAAIVFQQKVLPRFGIAGDTPIRTGPPDPGDPTATTDPIDSNRG